MEGSPRRPIRAPLAQKGSKRKATVLTAGRIARTRTEFVLEQLRQAILDQQLLPGVRLPEDAIGESFGTSRTIAREALGRLAVEGLVELKPNRGAFVANPSLDEGRDIFVVRRGLERMVAELLAGNLKPDHVAALEAMAARERRATDTNPAEAIRLAGEFHLLLARFTGNALLERYVREVVSRCSLILAMYGRPHSSECGVAEHAAIVEALVAGDGARAGQMMDEHLRHVAGRALLQEKNPRDVRDVLAVYGRRSRT